MKSYYSNYPELTAAWVAGNCSRHSYTSKKRMFTEGDCIYSYGGHFCIAVKWTAPDTKREFFLVTERDYSPTTRTHIKAVVHAIPDHQLVNLPQVDDLSSFTSTVHTRLVPGHRFNLTGDDATESDLGMLNLYHEVWNLDEYAGKFLRKRSSWGGVEHINQRFESARESVARFGMTLPARMDSLLDQCRAHHAYREKRNAELIANAPNPQYK